MSHPSASRRAAILIGLCMLAVSLSAEGALRFGVARPLAFNVSDYSDPQGKTWIRYSCAFECLYRARVDEVVAKLWDFADSPKIFSRIEMVRVRSDTGTEAVTEQRTAVRLLGLAFVSNLVFRNTIERSGPGSAKVNFESIETDGSSLSSKGGWTLEDRSDQGGPATYAVYRLESFIAPRFPGQAAIMRAFGAGDEEKLMGELARAVSRS